MIVTKCFDSYFNPSLFILMLFIVAGGGGDRER